MTSMLFCFVSAMVDWFRLFCDERAAALAGHWATQCHGGAARGRGSRRRQDSGPAKFGRPLQVRPDLLRSRISEGKSVEKDAEEMRTKKRGADSTGFAKSYLVLLF